MPRRSFRLLAGLIGFGVLAAGGAAQTAPRSSTGPGDTPSPESAEDHEFEPASNLADALERALRAVRVAEQPSVKPGDKAQAMREADFYVQEAEGFEPNNYKAEFIAGRLNRLIGRSRDAFRQVQDYVSKSPEGSVDWEGFKILGDMFLAGTYYVQAATKFSRAAQLAPKEASIFISWSRCCLAQGKRSEAITLAEQAVQLDSLSAEPHGVLANALLADQKLIEAKSSIRTAIERTHLELREDPASQVLLGDLRRRYQSLQEILDKLLKNDPTDGSVYLELADAALAYSDVYRRLVLHELQRRLKDGIQATQPKTPPELIERFAEFSAAIMKHEQAVKVLQTYLEANPLDETARRTLRRLEVGMEAQASAPR